MKTKIRRRWEDWRRIDGDMFEAIGVTSVKTRASAYAKALRVYGIKVRVLFIKAAGGYVVFTKDGKSISPERLKITKLQSLWK